MSEYQYVAFRAIDGPVSEKNLEFMREQSTRAKVTSWSFENEYHFGDFHGNAIEMLRGGYDLHFHYSNFGDRKLMIRLPNGLPDAKAAEPYLGKDSVQFLKDKKGHGGILCIDPFFEAGELDDLMEPDGLFEDLLSLRAEILNGDLRPFYLGYLAVAFDGNHDPDEKDDAPVPAGMGKLTKAQRAMAELYGISNALIGALAQDSPPLPKRADIEEQHASWMKSQPEATKTAWLCQLMADPKAAVRSEILAAYQRSRSAPSWPTKRMKRTIAELLERAEGNESKGMKR